VLKSTRLLERREKSRPYLTHPRISHGNSFFYWFNKKEAIRAGVVSALLRFAAI